MSTATIDAPPADPGVSTLPTGTLGAVIDAVDAAPPGSTLDAVLRRLLDRTGDPISAFGSAL